METVREGSGSCSRGQERTWRYGHHLHSGGGGGYDGGGGGGGGGRARRSVDDVHTIRLAMEKIDSNMALPSKSAGGTLAPELLTPRCPRPRLGRVTYSQATKSSGSERMSLHKGHICEGTQLGQRSRLVELSKGDHTLAV